MFLNDVVVGFVYKTLVEFLFVPVTSLVIDRIKKRANRATARPHR